MLSAACSDMGVVLSAFEYEGGNLSAFRDTDDNLGTFRLADVVLSMEDADETCTLRSIGIYAPLSLD